MVSETPLIRDYLEASLSLLLCHCKREMWNAGDDLNDADGGGYAHGADILCDDDEETMSSPVSSSPWCFARSAFPSISVCVSSDPYLDFRRTFCLLVDAYGLCRY